MFLPPFIACPERSEGGQGGKTSGAERIAGAKWETLGQASKRLFEIK